MTKSSQIIAILLLLTFLLIQNSSATWIQTANLQTFIPGHVYQVYCNNGWTISGRVTWQGSTDIDVKIYRSGMNIFGDSSAIFQYSNTGVESISYTVPSTSNYFVKVFVYATSQDVDFLLYNLNLQCLPYAAANYTNIFINKFAYKLKSIFKVANPLYPHSASIYYTSQSTQSAQVLAFSNIENSENLTSGSPKCLPATSHWYFVISDGLTSATTISPYNIQFYYHDKSDQCEGCAAGYTWNSITKSCEANLPANKQSSTNTSNTLGIVLGCVGGLIVIAGIIIGFCCYRRHMQKKYEQNPNQVKEQHSKDNLRASQGGTCSICLDNMCDTSLPCSHTFHRKCITEWQKRNNHCPLCRAKFTKSKIGPFDIRL